MPTYPDDDQAPTRFPDDDEDRQRYAESVFRHHQKRKLTAAEREVILDQIRRNNPVLGKLLDELYCRSKPHPK